VLCRARWPVISVNGNTAALAAKEIVALSRVIPARLEVNLFHASKLRERRIVDRLRTFGASTVFLPDRVSIPGVASNRRMISSEGQKKADVVLVALEDGDRTEALCAMGKTVIAIDLNPLSRTAQRATITIVDHINRALPILINAIKHAQKHPQDGLPHDFRNADILNEAEAILRGHSVA
jgi:4-phosphopantoate--beta-alanine ligase